VSVQEIAWNDTPAPEPEVPAEAVQSDAEKISHMWMVAGEIAQEHDLCSEYEAFVDRVGGEHAPCREKEAEDVTYSVTVAITREFDLTSDDLDADSYMPSGLSSRDVEDVAVEGSATMTWTTSFQVDFPSGTEDYDVDVDDLLRGQGIDDYDNAEITYWEEN
jgi:hypothetical protein